MEINLGELIAVAPVFLAFVISGLIIYGLWVWISTSYRKQVNKDPGVLNGETMKTTFNVPPAQIVLSQPKPSTQLNTNILPPIPNRPKIRH